MSDLAWPYLMPDGIQTEKDKSQLGILRSRILSSLEDGMEERGGISGRLANALLRHGNAPWVHSRGMSIPELWESVLERSRAIDEATDKKDWPEVNYQSKKRLGLMFLIASSERSHDMRQRILVAIQDRLELLDILAFYIPGIKEKEWGLMIQAKTAHLLFR